MPVRHFASALLCSAVVPSMATAQFATSQQSALTNLSAAQLDSVGNGSVLLQTSDVPNAPWPRVRTYAFIGASPEESAAMLSDYEHQPAYNKKQIWTRVVSRPDRASAEVVSRYGIPWAPDIEYKVLDSVAPTATGGYAVSWRLLESEALSRADGSATFNPWRNPITGAEGTMLVYEHFVIPRSSFARFVPDSRARGGVLAATRAIVAEVERERRHDSGRLEKQVAALRIATSR